MDQDIIILKEIQEWDRQIYSFKETLDEIPRELEQLSRESEHERAAASETQASLQKLQLRQKEKEGELAAKEANIKKYENQLTQVKTNKEYSSLQSEIVGLKADNSLLEEAIIVLIDQVEAGQAKLRDQQKKLEEKRAAFEAKKKELEANAAQIREQVSALIQKRNEKIKQVHPEIASMYDRVVSKRQGLALVKVEGENCPACQMQLRPQVMNEIQLKEKLVVCESCSRILYSE